jgi:hypothetical protein
MNPDRVVLITVATAAVTSIAAALMIADGSTWPSALLYGLAAGGATLWGLLSWFGGHQP